MSLCVLTFEFRAITLVLFPQRFARLLEAHIYQFHSERALPSPGEATFSAAEEIGRGDAAQL